MLPLPTDHDLERITGRCRSALPTPLPRLDTQRKYSTIAQLENWGCTDMDWIANDKGVRALCRRAVCQDQLILPERIQACSPRNPCESGACTICTGEFCVWAVSEALAQVYSYPLEQLSFVTYIPPDATSNLGELEKLDWSGGRKRMQRALRDATAGSNAFVIGGTDISLNESIYGAWQSYWQLHCAAIVVGPTVSQTREMLRALPRDADNGAKRPVHVQAVTHLPPLLSYLWKRSFNRRIEVEKGSPLKRNLKGPQLAELLPVLDKIGFDNRLVLCRIRRQGNHLVNLSEAKQPS